MTAPIPIGSEADPKLRRFQIKTFKILFAFISYSAYIALFIISAQSAIAAPRESYHSARSITIRQGDSLYKIAREELGDVRRWHEIADLNLMSPPYALTPGATLDLPDTAPVSALRDTAMPVTADSQPIRESITANPPTPSTSVPLTVSASLDKLGMSEPISGQSDQGERVEPQTQNERGMNETIAPSSSLASSSSSSSSENLDMLLATALVHNREILAAKAFAEAGRARIKPAGSLEDPTLGVGYQEGSAFRDFPSLGKDPFSQVMITIEQMFPGPGKRALREEIARHIANHLAAEAEAVTVRILSRVKISYWDLYRIDRESDIVFRTRDNLRALAKGVEARYSVGQAMQEDALRAGLEISMATERIRMLQRERRATSARLNALLDRAPDFPLQKVRDVDVTHNHPISYSAAELDGLARNRDPAVEMLRHIVMHDEAALRLAEKSRMPDFGVQAGVYPRGSLDLMWSLGFKMTLPIRQGARQNEWIREARANLEGSRQNMAAKERDDRARMEELIASSEAAHDLIGLYDSTIIPQAEFAVRASLSGYQVGRVNFMTVIANIVSLRQYETERARRISELHQADAELESITGRSLSRREMP